MVRAVDAWARGVPRNGPRGSGRGTSWRSGSASADPGRLHPTPFAVPLGTQLPDPVQEVGEIAVGVGNSREQRAVRPPGARPGVGARHCTRTGPRYGGSASSSRGGSGPPSRPPTPRLMPAGGPGPPPAPHTGLLGTGAALPGPGPAPPSGPTGPGGSGGPAVGGRGPEVPAGPTGPACHPVPSSCDRDVSPRYPSVPAGSSRPPRRCSQRRWVEPPALRQARSGSIQDGGLTQGWPRCMLICQPAESSVRWWNQHRRTPLSVCVAPPSWCSVTWWISHQDEGTWHPGITHSPSRSVIARLWWRVNTR